MKITLLQQDIVWGDPCQNVKDAESVMDKFPGSDIYVLPEMFSTGFCTQPHGLAESAESQTLQWMKEYAGTHDCAVAGSVAVNENEAFFNRFYFVKPDGTYAFYDKKHLFTYGGEQKHFSAGNRRVVVEFRGWRILLQVCYDLRFPVWSRNRKDYDLILYVASWPASRIEAWDTLLHARAIENQCYVAGVNRVGTDPSCEYCGGTVLVDPYGRTVTECPRHERSAVTAEMDKAMLEAFREKFPVLDDADDFEIRNKNNDTINE